MINILLNVGTGAMEFVSCADESPEGKKRVYSFKDAVFAGWADDGGMLVPAVIPSVSIGTLKDKWSKLSYPELCYEIMRLYIAESEIPNADLKDIILNKSFSRFGQEGVVRLKEDVLGSGSQNSSSKLHVAELWHGPTLAFKDLGMQVLAQILSYFLKQDKATSQKGSHLNLLVGTSGDTGSSAIEAVRQFDNISIVVLYPKGRGISLLQELQMTTVGETDKNVKVIAVDGSSDDLDVPIESCFNDIEFKHKYNLGSVNSVNICRVLVQVVHYFFTYLKICPLADRSSDIAFSIPTGAAGHLSAGVLACKMGLPVTHLHAATNANDVLHHILSRGKTRPKVVDAVDTEVVSTISPSMDILVPYNLERLVYFATGGNSKLAKDLMASFRATGELSISNDLRESLNSKLYLFSSSNSDQSAVEAMQRVYKGSPNKYVIDPHTAVGVSAALKDKALSSMKDIICMACAHPAKFEETTSKALLETGNSNLNPKRTKMEAFWWLSPEDEDHDNIKCLMQLQGRAPVAEFYSSNQKQDWAKKLRKFYAESSSNQ